METKVNKRYDLVRRLISDYGSTLLEIEELLSKHRLTNIEKLFIAELYKILYIAKYVKYDLIQRDSNED